MVERADELSIQLAKMHGISRSAAVKAALQEKLRRDFRALNREERLSRLTALAESFSAKVGPRVMTDDEAIGYDEFGRPT
jgi:hypothetical protein